ncbi:MAG: phage integrase N-terminal SAM-like domain-containing protein [Chloroflexi bacterium]|nr:phage integrase N-terminal SAM-like domain-containing protein [Chloroflexota bacterium]
MLLKKAIDLFLGEYKATTRKTYAASLTILRDYLGPARPLADIQPAHVIEFFQKVIYSRDLAPATIQKHTKTVKTFLTGAFGSIYS